VKQYENAGFTPDQFTEQAKEILSQFLRSGMSITESIGAYNATGRSLFSARIAGSVDRTPKQVEKDEGERTAWMMKHRAFAGYDAKGLQVYIPHTRTRECDKNCVNETSASDDAARDDDDSDGQHGDRV
jgi:hypothetical protein